MGRETRFDIIVVGLGAMGSATARDLAGRGYRVLGLERFGPAHDQGSSHGETRVIRQAYFESPDYVPLAIAAYPMWRELERETKRTLMELKGALMIGQPESEVFRGSLQSARKHSLEHQIYTRSDLRKRWPLFHLPEGYSALFENQAGILHVEACVSAMLDSAARSGADLRYQTPVTGWQAKGNNIRVETDSGSFEADHLILTPGAWLSGLIKLPAPLQPERLVMHWFSPRSDEAVKDLPVYLWQINQGPVFYGMPPLAGRLKAAFHDIKTPCDPDQVKREVDAREIQEIRYYLDRYMPDLAKDHIAAKTCFYTMTPDSNFVIGPHPQNERVWIACGFSGHGFKFAPVVGQILGDLVQTGETTHPICLFDPKRKAPG